MANTSKTDELFEMLRARGLRKRAARALSDAAGAGRSGAAASQQTAQRLIDDLRSLADELEGRITGKSPTRTEAAKKAARTRARKATARSTAAKKAAATRKRATTKSSSSRASSTGTRRRSSAKKT